MHFEKIKSLLLYAGIGKKEYSMISPMIWRGNINNLRITIGLAITIGVVFLIPNLALHTGYWIPYVFLISGSLVMLGLLLLIRRRGDPGAVLSMAACYGQMLIIFAYACVLSAQKVNFDLPAVSVIVFITLLPLSIDDRPVRMFAFMIGESAIYLIISSFSKNQRAFLLDIENVAAFCVVGMVLYAVICSRNIRELYQSVRIEKIQKSVISSLATVVEERDESTGGHITRCEAYVERLLERMKERGGFSELTDRYCGNVVLAAAMHDIGKIKIPDSILNKPGRLTEEEYEIMKKHSEYGEEIIQKTMSDIEEEEYCRIARNIARYHHERYDGKGYPDGLKGEDIPLEARIMALADVYDALEMLPWLRTFTGRVTDLECTDRRVINRFWKDFDELEQMYCSDSLLKSSEAQESARIPQFEIGGLHGGESDAVS